MVQAQALINQSSEALKLISKALCASTRRRAFSFAAEFDQFAAQIHPSQPERQHNGADDEVGVIAYHPPGQRNQGGEVAGGACNKFAQEDGEKVLGNAASARGGAHQHNYPHHQLTGINKHIVGKIYRAGKCHNQEVDHPEAGCPRKNGAQKCLSPENQGLPPQFGRGYDHLITGDDCAFAEAPERFKRGDFYKQPLKTTGVEKNAVSNKQGEEQNDGISDKKHAHGGEGAASEAEFGPGHRGAAVSGNEKNQRYHDDVKQLIEHGRNYHNGGGAPDAQLFLGEDKYGDGRAAHHRRGYAADKLPQHNYFKRLAPAQRITGEQPDAVHIGQVAHHHHGKCQEKIQKRIPPPVDGGQIAVGKVAQNHVNNYAQPYQYWNYDSPECKNIEYSALLTWHVDSAAG